MQGRCAHRPRARGAVHPAAGGVVTCGASHGALRRRRAGLLHWAAARSREPGRDRGGPHPRDSRRAAGQRGLW
eukprot:992620-Pyramimonas_sp.AAC.1